MPPCDDLSLYLHIPFCVSKCAYCDFLSFPLDKCGCTEAYFDALCREIALYKDSYGGKISSLYIGGGTPSVATKWLPQIFEALNSTFYLPKDAEISIECNPESVSENFLQTAKTLGVNRVSLGVQSLNDNLLCAIGRAHDKKQALCALDAVCKNFSNVNADVMFGLPGQTSEDVQCTLDTLLTYPLTHLSAYGLIMEKGTPLCKMVRNGRLVLPDDDTVAEWYDAAVCALREKGFERYEISNFCISGKECAYNSAVWNYKSYLGLGLGAASYLNFYPHASCGKRFNNVKNLDLYIKRAFSGTLPTSKVQIIRPDEAKFECIMLGLRLEKGVDITRFNYLFNTDFLREYGDKLIALKQYLNVSERFVSIKPHYFYLSNSIISELV